MSKESASASAIPITPNLPQVEDSASMENSQPPVNSRVFLLSLQAVVNAVIIGVIAWCLIKLINLITNISFYGVLSLEEASPAHHQLGILVIAVPVLGALIIGIMARFGSPAIRGHGIPEAMEQVLLNQSKIRPIITFLKPLSSAISIGTGGPFGAEGPIIATGGAFGSFAGQVMKISPSERKIMLAAGACAGMATIFGTPLAAVLLAIELLLFEFSPRSIIPVALACVTGAALHFVLFGTEPVFGMAAISEPTAIAVAVYVFMGAAMGVLASLVSKSIYLIEDLFEKLPIHWMWWPAIGAVVVGVVGYFAPSTLGVGYENISAVLSGEATIRMLLVLCFLKFISWAFSLGSGTSGGTLAPLLTIGGASGALLGLMILNIFPGAEINVSTAALIGMAAMFAGASRAFLTSIVFALETTMEPHGLLPVVAACTAAYFVSFFLMKGSIMTEKINRRGVHTPDSFEPDILQRITANEVMNTDADIISPHNSIKELREWLKRTAAETMSPEYVVADDTGKLEGMVRREAIFDKSFGDDVPLTQLLTDKAPYIFEDNRLSLAADLMHRYRISVLPVVVRDGSKTVSGVLTHKDIFTAYSQRRNEEHIHARALSLRRRGIRLIVRGRRLLDE